MIAIPDKRDTMPVRAEPAPELTDIEEYWHGEWHEYIKIDSPKFRHHRLRNALTGEMLAECEYPHCTACKHPLSAIANGYATPIFFDESADIKRPPPIITWDKKDIVNTIIIPAPPESDPARPVQATTQGIAALVYEKMSVYLNSGVDAATAAHFTKGEVKGLYQGVDYSKDSAGNWRKTPVPEPIDEASALAKCEGAIAAFLAMRESPLSIHAPARGATTKAAPMNGKTEYKHQLEEAFRDIPEQHPATTAPEPEAQTEPPAAPVPPIPKPTKTATVNTPEARQGLEALRHVAENGVPVKSFYDKSPDTNAASYSYDAATLCKQGNRFKAFIQGRFLALDIDRNHKDGVDGLRNLETFLDSIGKPRNLRPSELQDIAGGSFPCYVTTPSGGYHLYFKYNGTPSHGAFTQGVEIKTISITAPGSFKDGKPYILHGSINAAPLLYGFIEARLSKSKAATRTEPRFTPLGKKKFESAITWRQIVEWTDADGQGGVGRNEWAYSAALHAKTHDWNQSDTLEALRHEPRIEGLPDSEIISVVNSAWRK